MELRRYLRIVRRRLLLIVAIVVAALAAGYFITPRAHTYTGTATLYVGSRSINVDPRSGDVSGQRVQGFDRLITTFTQMIRSRSVATAAVARTGVNQSPGAVSGATQAEQIVNTNLIRVSVTQDDAAAARGLTNGVSDAFVQQIKRFEPSNTGSDQIASVYQRASLPGPNPSSLPRNLALAGLFGLLVAGALVALLEYTDISLRSSEDVERHLELPVLGVVPALGDRLPVPTAKRVRNLQPQRQPRFEREPTIG
jgi:capsular polysaccharide biosynthesis protein